MSQNTPPQDKSKDNPSPLETAIAQFNNTVGIIYGIAALSAIVGSLDLLFNFLGEGLGLTSLIAAPIYGALGLWVQKRRSSFALGLTLGIYLAHSLALLIARIETFAPGDRPPISIIISGLGGLYLLFEGFGNIKQLKSAEKSAETTEPSPTSDANG